MLALAQSAVVLGNQTLLLGLLHVVPHEPEQGGTNDRVDDRPNAEAPSEANCTKNRVGSWSITPCVDEPGRCSVRDPLDTCQL